VLHQHHGGLDQAEQVLQLGVVLAHQRIGGRHRRGRQARLQQRLHVGAAAGDEDDDVFHWVSK
ncbi:MAG: hypothetical protein RLZZ115_428, partial [Cyanobacteriota bacterium]